MTYLRAVLMAAYIVAAIVLQSPLAAGVAVWLWADSREVTE